MAGAVAHAPPSARTRSPHWPTETTTSTTRPGQADASPSETAAPRPGAPAEHADSASAARAASAATVRGTTAELLATDNDSQNQYAGRAAPDRPRASGERADQRVPQVQRSRVGRVHAEPVDQAVV